MAKVANHIVSSKKPKLAERIAFQPFTPQQDLINELIRNMINPDSDIGRSYYVGEVLKIIENSNALIDNRDIFYSITDNSERASKRDTSDQEYNADRVILLVHVPSFITSNKVNTYDLNYDNFLKLRVEYDQKKGAVKVGNVVKIQFHQQNALYFPVVVDIADVSLDDIEKSSTKAKEEFNKYLECKILAIDAANKIGSNDFDISNKPYGGYIQAIQEIENVFSPVFVEPFKKNLSEATYGKPSQIEIRINTISLNQSVYAKFKENIKSNKTITTFSPDDIKYYSDNKQEYLILGKEVVISADPEKVKNNQNLNNQLRKEFFDFLKQDFSSRLGYSFLTDKLPPGVDFELNINAFLSYSGDQTPSLQMYIDKSEKTISSPTFYSRVPASGSAPQTIQQKSTVDKCDNELPTDNGLYPLVYDGKKYGVDHDTIDNNIIQLFYNDKVKQSDFIGDNKYFLKLANLENTNNLLKLNKTFYREQENANDAYGITNNNVGIVYINDSLNLLRDLLQKMQKKIASNEKLNEDNILIVPRQVLKKKVGIVSQGEDPNSRHYYGRAIDIAIYLKTIEDNVKTIRQIRPEIVVFYAERVRNSTTIETLGHGLFLQQQTKYYNHIEILRKNKEVASQIKNSSGNGFKNLTQDQRFFTGNITDIEKQVEAASQKLKKLKEIIELSKDFKVPGPLNELDKRFKDLLKG